MARTSLTAAALTLFVALPAQAADGPQFSTGGFVFSLQYGAGLWNLDRAGLTRQVGAADANLFIAEAQSTHTLAIRAAYNILGHASVGIDFTGTGWNLFNDSRGGAGFLGGMVAWHPLELVFMKKAKRPFPFDFSPWFGVGYGIAGQHRGMDGVVIETGLNADYWFARYFGVGLFVRAIFMQWNSFYVDYNNRSVAGATVHLPNGSGGNFVHLGLSLHFRAGD